MIIFSDVIWAKVMLRLKKTLFVKCFVLCSIFSQFLVAPAWCVNPIEDTLLYPPNPVGEDKRAAFGVVGVARGYYMPEMALDTFAKNKSIGVSKGAAEGFLEAVSQMGHCSGQFCGIALLIWVATAGTAGATYGAIQGYMTALPAEEAEKVEQAIKEFYSSVNLQERISEKLLRMARDKGVKKTLVPIEGRGPNVPGEEVDYRPLRNVPIDTVVEYCVTNFGFMTWPRELKPPKNISVGGEDPSLALFLRTRTRVIRLSDNKEIYYRPEMHIQSRFLKRSEWEMDNFKLFSEDTNSLMEELTDKVSDDLFITYASPDETLP